MLDRHEETLGERLPERFERSCPRVDPTPDREPPRVGASSTTWVSTGGGAGARAVSEAPRSGVTPSCSQARTNRAAP